MKKGCFITLITLITILVMVGIYIYKTKKELFKNYGKEKVISLASDELNEKITNLKLSPYKDSLIYSLRKEVEFVKKKDFEKAMNQFGLVAEKIKLVISDGIIDSTEYAEVKALVKSHERSEKN